MNILKRFFDILHKLLIESCQKIGIFSFQSQFLRFVCFSFQLCRADYQNLAKKQLKLNRTLHFEASAACSLHAVNTHQSASQRARRTRA